MRYLVFLFILNQAFAAGDFQSPIREICEQPVDHDLTKIQNLEDARSSCKSLIENSTAELAVLSRDVLAALEQLSVTNPTASVSVNKELRKQVGRLADAVSAAAVSQSESPREKLGAAIQSLAIRFAETDFRRKNRDEYYNSIKEIIAQTSQGRRVINCFENNPDKRIGKYEVLFIGDGDRRPGNDEAAYLDFETDQADPNKRMTFKMNIDLRTNPLAAISMVAHEMQHACLGSTISDHINECTDTDESECTQFNEAIVVDELTAHNFEAQFFAEIARSAPELMCSYTYMDAVEGPLRLADLHAMNEESYRSGNLLSLLNGRYVRAGLWGRTTVYDPLSVQPGPRNSIQERLNRLGIPPQK